MHPKFKKHKSKSHKSLKLLKQSYNKTMKFLSQVSDKKLLRDMEEIKKTPKTYQGE
jgi:hypothetical protein